MSSEEMKVPETEELETMVESLCEMVENLANIVRIQQEYIRRFKDEQ